MFARKIPVKPSRRTPPESPAFQKFCEKVFGKDNLLQKRAALYEIIGYCISDITGVKKAIFLLGPSNCGKSVILRFIQRLVGEGEVSNVSLANFAQKFSPVEMYGKTLNISGEVPSSALPGRALDPHFHLMLETLNVITGKQFSQSPSDLALLKNFGSAALRKAGLNEEILTSDIYEISEEDFWQSEEQEAFDNDADNNAEYKETEKDEWNNGTDGTKNREENFQSAMYNKAEIKKQNLEREEMGYAPRKAKRVEPAVQKEMCHVVIPTNKEMCHVVEIPFGQRLNSTVPEQREMCRTVFQRQQGINTDNITGKTMCVIVK